MSRDRAHNRFLLTRDALDWKNFKDSRDSVKRRFSKAERKYSSEEVQLHKHNPSSLWKIINRLIPSKNQERLTYSKDFNRFFSSVGRNAANASIRLAEDNNIILPEPTPETVPLLPDERDVNSPCHLISPVDQVSWFRQSKYSYNQRLPPCHIRSYHRDYQLLHYYEHISNNMEDGRIHTYPQRKQLTIELYHFYRLSQRFVKELFIYLLRNKRLSSHQSGNKKFLDLYRDLERSCYWIFRKHLMLLTI